MKPLSSYIKMCWIKTVIGDWCIGIRLSTFPGRLCIFGCCGQRDELCHYLVCPPLWHIARECLNVHEASVEILHILCIVDPTEDKFKCLAFCHALYHCCVNDTRRGRAEGVPKDAHTVQSNAYENVQFCLHYLRGR